RRDQPVKALAGHESRRPSDRASALAAWRFARLEPIEVDAVVNPHNAWRPRVAADLIRHPFRYGHLRIDEHAARESLELAKEALRLRHRPDQHQEAVLLRHNWGVVSADPQSDR